MTEQTDPADDGRRTFPRKRVIEPEEERERILTRARGRPSDYTAELGEEILELVAGGMSFNEIAELDGMPSARTIFRWQANIPNFCHEMKHAREAGAWVITDRGERYSQAVLEALKGKEGASAAASAVLRWTKWRAEILSPRAFGPLLRHAGADGDAIPLAITTISTS